MCPTLYLFYEPEINILFYSIGTIKLSTTVNNLYIPSALFACLFVCGKDIIIK